MPIKDGRLVPVVHAGREHRHGDIPGRGPGPGQSTRPQSPSSGAGHEGRHAGRLIRRIVFVFVGTGTGGESTNAGRIYAGIARSLSPFAFCPSKTNST